MDEYALSDYGELLYAIDRALDSEIFNLHDPLFGERTNPNRFPLDPLAEA